jgi:type VI secretion system protein ImpE
MSESTKAGELYQAGQLSEAISAASAAVRAAPGVVAPRILLAELLLTDGKLERADVVLDAASDVDPQAAIVVAEFRQLLRADLARRDLHTGGRLPEFIGEPTPALKAALAAHVAVREGDFKAAASAAILAETLRPRLPGRHGDTPFDDIRDACDLHAGFVDVLTTTGKYFWIPTERIECIEFHEPRTPRDLIWRRASVSVTDGPNGDVYIPAIYVSIEQQDDAVKLGRATEWLERDGLVTGLGQRIWLVGDDGLALQALSTFEFGA